MNNDTPQGIEPQRKPMRTAKRIRFSQLPLPLQAQAINLIFHRDAESVARRYEVHQTDLVEAFAYHIYDCVQNSGPKGPTTNVIQFRRAA